MTEEQKELIDRAARYEGMSTSRYVVKTLQEKSRKVLRDKEIIMLSKEDQRKVIEALTNPPKPNASLKESFRLRQELIGKR